MYIEETRSKDKDKDKCISGETSYPILDSRISVLLLLRPSRSGYPPANSATGWTGELWSKTKFLILEN